MKPTKELNRYFHAKLPIGSDETVIGYYKHHVMAYIIPLLIAVTVIFIVLGLTVLLTSPQFSAGTAIIAPQYSQLAFIFSGLFSLLVLAFSYIPVWIKTQEKLVLTDEALFQVLQTSLFSDKVSQLSLQQVADITVRQDFLGNLFGYGKLTIETPGEQDNYEFTYIPDPNSVANDIAEAHERFITALESGTLPQDPDDISMATNNTHKTTISVDPEQYQRFLAYQKQSTPQPQAPQTATTPDDSPIP